MVEEGSCSADPVFQSPAARCFDEPVREKRNTRRYNRLGAAVTVAALEPEPPCRFLFGETPSCTDSKSVHLQFP